MRRSDVKGGGGEAWNVPLDRYSAWIEGHQQDTPAAPIGDSLGADATLALWYVRVALWGWWSVGLVTLADVPGMPPAAKQYPGAEYELLIIRIDEPGTPPVDGDGPWFGDDVELAWQFHGVTYGQARDIALSAVEATCAGMMIPGVTGLEKWREALGKIAADYRAGKFGPVGVGS